MPRKIGPLAAALLVSALVLTGCAAEPAAEPATGANTQPDNAATPGTEPSTPAEPEATPVTQEESCDWATPRMDSGSASAPRGQNGDIATVLIGAWQHTHIDSEALKPTTDIRYVFASTSRMLYCQDVAGATSQAENAADITLNGTEITLDGGASLYGIVAWDANTMVWTNHRDGTSYLLQRR